MPNFTKKDIEDFVIIGTLPRGCKTGELKGAYIKEYAIVGANSTLLPGIVVGMHALIGAGSVVTKDVPDNVVIAGNPVKQINKIENLPY